MMESKFSSQEEQTEQTEQTGFFKLGPRVSRIQYLGLMSFWGAILSLVYVIPLFLLHSPLLEGLSMLIVTVVPFVCLIAMVIVTIKRLHDCNMSGYWVVLTLIIFFFIAIFFIPGTRGENKYGEETKVASKKDYILMLAFPLAWLLIIMGLVWLQPA